MDEERRLFVPDRLPAHESGLRRMLADADGTEYQAFQSLAEAKDDPDGVVILEGDDGGQIYLVAPAALVACSEDVLRQLLLDIDARVWADATMARVYFEKRQRGTEVAGGMGGAVVGAEPWIHPELRDLEWLIREILSGDRSRLAD